jgi:hypothetical protein
MAQNLPSEKQAALNWLEAHQVQWNNNLAAIGLTSAQMVDLGLEVANARQAFTSVQSIRADAKAETQTWYTKANSMRKVGSELITSIKAFAQNSDDPDAVYLLAGMTGKAPPSPIAPPNQPTIDNAQLMGNGSVIVNFSGTGPVGTVWRVSRKLDGETSFSIIGSADAKTKSYVDATIPTGIDSATYIVTGERGSQVGLPSFEMTARFGNAAAAAASQAA